MALQLDLKSMLTEIVYEPSLTMPPMRVCPNSLFPTVVKLFHLPVNCALR
jgi:hypothetical protein